MFSGAGTGGIFGTWGRKCFWAPGALPFSLNQIKYWKQLKAHPLSGLIPMPLFNKNTVSFQAGLAPADLGKAVAWKVDRASLFPLPAQSEDMTLSPLQAS